MPLCDIVLLGVIGPLGGCHRATKCHQGPLGAMEPLGATALLRAIGPLGAIGCHRATRSPSATV